MQRYCLTGGSPFRLLKPLSEAADEKRMNQLLSLLSETELKEMVTEAHQDNLQPWGLDKPVYTIALENPNWKSPVTVLMNPVLEAPGTFYVTRSDVLWVGRFASSRFEQLDFDLNGVIDKRLFSFQLQKVRRWEVWDTKLGHLIFEKKRGGFVMLAPQLTMVQETLMYQALKHFAYIEGATLLVKGVTGDVEWQDSKTEKWTTKMTFYDSKDKRLGELTLFENEQGIYGVSSERSETFKMSPQTQKYLPGRIEAWLKQ